MHEKRNGKPEIPKEKSARESKLAMPRQERDGRSARESESAVSRQERDGRSARANQSRPCRVGKENGKEEITKESKKFTLVTGYRYKHL